MTGKATTLTPTGPAQHTPDRAEDEAEFRRWTLDEVIAKQLLPYKSVRVLRDKCYRREVHHHLDGGRITFTADDIRKENARTAVTPFEKPAA
ncbi:hypothetical protein PV728_29270 [Streptomyces europaeiscabiei]|uniref:hypothetical protein n=1 Tax=Streptomyces europaeiscabiei TaxID=146819 RepID=UPI0029B10BCB|nr:hypothetical protein [Streptomyces europaeiscabiei]MDX3634281.1 hypothetical protein [Streptomyces europaeiscabiei]MDX3651871.1 hypothetical protein [Streptomyces europaeiscabiei]